MAVRPFLIHALSPLHAGTGQAVDIIDLPIARMRSTGIPIVPGSSIKGSLRNTREKEKGAENADVLAAFGPAAPVPGENGEEASEYAGAVQVGDARLLALPVRSFKGTFAWVSSPLLLELASRDLQGTAGLPKKAPKPVSKRLAFVAEGNVNQEDKRLFLEDLDLTVRVDPLADEWAQFFAGLVMSGQKTLFSQRFVVVDDETMTFLWETCTQIDTRIRMNPETGTVAKGALWTEESLPPETLMVGLMTGNKSYRGGSSLSAKDVLNVVLGDEESVVQFGGKATVGRGRCRLLPLTAGKGGA
jgi:CRISPR-associated protein Cmr4